MFPEPWPSEASASSDLLAKIVRGIDERGRRMEEDLLTHFLLTAWPTPWSQAQ